MTARLKVCPERRRSRFNGLGIVKRGSGVVISAITLARRMLFGGRVVIFY
jgi:hypothetical protein